ncbi:hypothetical protein [Vibrio marisflavi]|uniref:Uncharacterized protein n=1 Tax=Vibrio marisflavi CECT 7928 TaxID=634439 RepID=A0ABM9A2H6_9VIBR|nr:hypothetical protein [Vibrio marisflavi]CAH0538558.1 hypothetical protein VMF7928_01480 [Vibrio marisflavi CECT 7928]
MTTLISWLTYDQRGPASLYVASDSRLSWGQQAYWDSGRKIYYSGKHALILGFCGEAMFCSQVMSQIVAYIDSCDVFEKTIASTSRFDLVYNLIKRSFGKYPVAFALDSFKIIYATRESPRNFHSYVIKWAKNKPKNQNWSYEKLSLPLKTGLVESLGSGATSYKNHYQKLYSTSDISGLSRSFYSSLSTYIETNEDPLTGGAIQLAGLFNVGSAKAHGVIKGEQRYIYGMEIDPHDNINNVRWVNERFENCDGNSIQRKPDAQIQPLPKAIRNPLGNST